jgi:hypothetical protein
LEETIRKAPGGSPYVHRDQVFDIDGIEVKGVLQLDASPADEWEIIPGDLDEGIRWNRQSGFQSRTAVHGDSSRKNQCLRPFAAGGKASINE